MIYRTWRPEDLPAILDGARDFESRLTHAASTVVARSADARDGAIAAFLRTPGVEVYLAEEAGELIAALGVVVGPCLWDRESREMTEGFWWARPDAPFGTAHRVFHTALAAFLAAGGGVLTTVSLASSPGGVGRFYRRLGLAPLQTVWSGRV